jgi:hypothetical protein
MALRPDERRAKELAESTSAALRDLASSIRSLPKDHIPEAIEALRNVANRIDAVAMQNNANNEETARFQRRSLNAQWWLLTATTAAFIAAGIYAYVAYLQKNVMNNTLTEVRKQSGFSEKSASAAMEAAKAARDANAVTFESTRARIARRNTQIDKPISIGNAINVVSYFENVGHSAAFNVRIDSDVRRWRGLPDGPMPVKIPLEGETLEVGPPGHQLYMIDSEPVKEDFLKGLPSIHPKGKELTTYFFGRFNYVTLGQEHYTEFCFYLTGYDSGGLPIRVQAVETRYTLMQCNKWHRAD